MAYTWKHRLDWLLIGEMARRFGIDPVLAGAVVAVESLGVPNAIRYEPGWQYYYRVVDLARRVGCSQDTMEAMQKTSWGLMQCMGTVAYEHGLAWREEPWERWATALLVPRIGLEYGLIVLQDKIRKYGSDPATAYAAYNAGTPRVGADGKFANQLNVDNFLRYYRELRG